MGDGGECVTRSEVPVAGVLGRLAGATTYIFVVTFGIVLYFISQHKIFYAYIRSWKPGGFQLSAHGGALLVVGLLVFIALGLIFSPADDNPRHETTKVEKKLV